MITLPPDFAELIRLFNRHEVKYLVVGGYAVIHHGFPRTTGDIDIFFAPTAANATRVYRALQDFWNGPIPHLASPGELLTGMGIQFGVEPNRIDLLNQIAGVSFDAAWPDRVVVEIEGMTLNFIGKADLLRAKRAANRPKDQEDINYLKK